MQAIINKLKNIAKQIRNGSTLPAYSEIIELIHILERTTPITPETIKISTLGIAPPAEGETEYTQVTAIGRLNYSGTYPAEYYKNSAIDIDARLKELLLRAMYGIIE